MPVRIGELLLKEKRITPEQLQEVLNYQRQHGGRLGANLVKLEFIKDDEITALLSKQYGVPSIALNEFEIDAAIIKLVPAETARKYSIVPLSRSGATLTIAMTDPDQRLRAGRREVHDRLQRRAGRRVRDGAPRGHRASTTAPTAAREDAAVVETGGERAGRRQPRARRNADPSADGDVEVIEDLEEISAETLARQGEEAPVVKLVNVILMSAIKKGASDIHIEPYEKEFRVRYRIDGILHDDHAAAAQDARRDHLAHQDHGEARHRREAPAAGRPHQVRSRIRAATRHRLPRLGPADALRREDRPASPRQVEACSST